ncbi:MAG: response regulator [Candidatus Nomurabacteria bacterium]|nr:response regulator [Candidatus Nomurabacteria bacterium]
METSPSSPTQSPPQSVPEREQNEKFKLNILVADDERGFHDPLKMVLENEGHKVTVVENGDLLIKELEKPGANFNLVIADNGMPEKKGIDALREIRSSGKLFNDIPVVVFTGDNNDDGKIQKDVEALGAVYVAKPFFANLFKAVEKIMEEKKK